MKAVFVAMPAERAEALWAGGPDDYGLAPERRVSDGDGVPCRHCLRMVEAGQDYLVLAYRPFPHLQPYAETGPVFLHAEPCVRAPDGSDLPEILLDSPDYIVRGYDADDRIVYGTGAVTPTQEIPARAAALLALPAVRYVHVRSAKNNCFQCRIEPDRR